MSIHHLMETVGSEQDWTAERQLEIALDYIANQQADDAFRDHLRQYQDEAIEAADNAPAAWQIGMEIEMPEPVSDFDAWRHAFTGNLVSWRQDTPEAGGHTLLSVVDQDCVHHEIEACRIDMSPHWYAVKVHDDGDLETCRVRQPTESERTRLLLGDYVACWSSEELFHELLNYGYEPARAVGVVHDAKFQQAGVWIEHY